MGLIPKEIKMKWNYKTKGWYKSRGYVFTEWGYGFIINVKDLSKGSHIKVEVKCDCCGKELKNIAWKDYLKYVKEDGKYFCHDCANKLYVLEKGKLTKLKNSKSFYDWCITHKREGILFRWDYKLNSCKPNEIGYGTSKDFYFKCPRGIHESELKNINTLTGSYKKQISCKQCNSFAQWGIDNLGKDFLDKYWDYEKNTIDPWIIPAQHNRKVWIKCQEKDYHGSYNIEPNYFVGLNTRCPYCVNRKIHPLDSLGTLFPESLNVWSDKNKKSPYEYSPKSSSQEVWWKCPNNIHKDFYRNILSSNTYKFRCPECNYSKGEKEIEKYFFNINFKKDDYYISQKTFEGLVGLNSGLLSYDFYLPEYNLLIEYQGEQHERYIKGFHSSKKQFEKQQEHDRRKREYAKDNNIKLLEIWYYDFDRIKEILNNVLIKQIQ